MKKLMFLVLLVSVSYIAQAQVKFGFKGGLSTHKFDPASSIIEGENLSLAMEDASYGYHAGLFTQIKAGKFFIQPEVVFNSNKVDYSLTDIANPNGEILSESYQYLDVPVMMGLKLGFLRLQAGPVGHVFVNSTSDLVDRVQNYEQAFDDFTLGYQAGFGLDFGRLIFDFKWENNFSELGDHISIGGTDFNFDQKNKRFVASVGFAF
jgi:hypothetical protein